MEPNFQPQTCIMAREFEGMTQTVLARELGVSQGKVSKIEDGVLSVTRETVQKLAEIFGRPSDFFYREDYTLVGMEGFYRKKCSVSRKKQLQANALMNIERLRIHSLDSIHKMIPTIPFCDPDEHEGGAKEIAQKIRRYCKVPNGPIVNLTAVIESVGCIIRYIDYGTLKIDGFSVVTDNNTPIIFINRAFPADRRRLTLAHEFGHIIMHREPRDTAEDEAYEFAGEFLMPENEIRHTLYPLKVDKLASLKLHWGVSMQAILMHGKRIGAITERYYRYLFMQMGKMGYRSSEPHSDRIKLEPVTKMSNMLVYLRKKHDLTDEDLLSTLAILPSELAQYQQEDNGNRFTIV